jgi:HSP20 family protein
MRSTQRAPVNIFKTETSYEMLVFAPGRLKENFSVEVKGQDLLVSYRPPEGFPRPDWVLREYSRGGFVRQFLLNETMDAAGISANYTDGVLHIHLPLKPGAAPAAQQIAVH